MWPRYRPRPLEIVDTTLREGQQTPLLHDHGKYFLTTEDKRDLLAALIRYGVKFVELFAPVVGPREAEDFVALRQVRDDLAPQYGYTFLLAHVRCHPRDVEAAVAAGFDGLNLYFGTSPQSRAFNHRKDTATIIRQSQSLLEDLRRHHPHLVLRFSGEDAFRTPLADLFQVYDAVAPLVDRLGLPDTVGTATPPLVAEAAVRGEIPRAGQRPQGAAPAVEILEQQPPSAGEWRRLPPVSFQPQGRVWKYGDHIDTDRLFPGKYTYTLHTPEEIAAHALEDLDPAFARRVRPGDVVFAGEHFGQGSSREQAVTGLVYNGVTAVVAKSFARIFYRNALNRGLPVIVCPPAVEAAQAGQPVRVDWRAGVIDLPVGRFTFPPFPPTVQALLAAGGLIPALQQSQREKRPAQERER